jgi:mRNA capping family enzyme
MFSLPPSFLPSLRYFLREVHTHRERELEFRFSTVDRDGPGSFAPVCDAGVFQRILSAYVQNAQPGKVSHEDTAEYIQANVRTICDGTTGEVLRTVHKHVLQKRDLTDYNFRMSLAAEEVINSANFGNALTSYNLLRRKVRTSVTDHILRYDFTRVRTTTPTQPDARVSYEVEVEYVGEGGNGWNPEDSCNFIVDGIHNMLAALQNSPIVLSVRERQEVLLEYAVLVGLEPSSGKPRFMGAQPRTLHRRDLPRIMGGYSVSEKLDGVRQLLLVCRNGEVHAVDRRMAVSAVGLHHPDVGTVLDAEFHDGVYHVFDVLIHRGRDLRGDPSMLLQQRLAIVNEVVGRFGRNRVIVTKPHHFEDADAVISAFTCSGRADGLIFTPSEEPHPRWSAWPSLLKWKPENQLSIDFQVRQTPKGGCEICVMGHDQHLIPFHHAGLSEDDTGKCLEGSIVECVYDHASGCMKVVRERTDKLRPNYHSVADDIWEAIQKPVAQSDLSSTTFHNLRRHHNSVKSAVLLRAFEIVRGNSGCPQGLAVLDLACGRGGDLGKFASSRCSAYHGVDVNSKLLEEARRRSRSMNMHCAFSCLDLRSDKVKLPTKVNLVTCNFALHYFWGTSHAWDSFAQTLTDNLEVGGVFACTLFDGMRVLKSLLTGGVPCRGKTGKGFDLVAQFDHRLELALLRKREFGLPLGVVMTGDAGVLLAKQETEFLVFADQLVHRMDLLGFVLRESSVFPTSPDLDLPERHLCALNRTYIFQYKGQEENKHQGWMTFSGTLPTHERSCPVVVSMDAFQPSDVCAMVTGKTPLADDGNLEDFASYYRLAIGVWSPNDREWSMATPSLIEPSTTLLFELASDGKYHVLAQEHDGSHHLRFLVPNSRPARSPPATPEESSDVASEELHEKTASHEEDHEIFFMGRSTSRGKGSWTLKELRSLGEKNGVRIPSSQKTKRNIAKFLEAALPNHDGSGCA